MRIFDEKNNNMLDTSHFRFIQLDGKAIRFFDQAFKEHVEWEKFAIEFDSEDDAKIEFDELSQEAGWFLFRWGKQQTLLNTFCFRRFFLASDENYGVCTYSLVFWNSNNDNFTVNYADRDSAINSLKSLVI